ncbi:MAG TPA: efflux RND transporter permease subunit, partial [Thermoanaerobaculia bacterium]
MTNLGFAGRVARAFIDSKLTPLIVVAAFLLGLFAVKMTPREEEPQIVVPMIDVIAGMPGASPSEVEQRVTKPIEKMLWEVPGVEYIYSTSSAGMSMIIVRFKVGENEERALVRVNDKMAASPYRDALIKPRSIDDVPVLALTLSSKRYDHEQLRRLAAALQSEIKQIPNVSDVTLTGGTRRQLRVDLDPARLAAFGLAPASVIPTIQQANTQLPAGAIVSGNREALVETGGFIRDAGDAKRIVLGVRNGRPIYLGDVASVRDGGEDPADYVFFGSRDHGVAPAVTISIAKRKATNATELSHTILRKVDGLKGSLIPGDVRVDVTRNYGETAAEKSNELLWHMLLAIASVTLLIALTLGRRESAIVAVAIPVTLALTLAIFFLFGYTLNRVTLFALIFSIGILVDDAIVVVENIVRHHRLPQNRRRSLRDVAIEAVAEVGNPTILATFTVIAAIIPMGFVRGLMGPYMRPIPVGASAAMLFSLVVAFVVTPWAAMRLLRRDGGIVHAEEGWLTRTYRRVMGRIIGERRLRIAFLSAIAILLVAAISLFAIKAVRVKMLPFDNKSEFQIIIDTPEGTPLERTAAVASQIGSVVATVPEVANYQIYAGTASPFNFNGLVRHYFMRRGSNVADVQVNLVPKGDRKAQSHAIAKRVRTMIAPVAQRWGARVKVAEVPPGPPVLQTLVAEIYGPDYARQIAIGKQVETIFDRTAGVADVDSYTEDDQPQFRFVVDKEKAALSGIAPQQIDATLRLALSGMPAGLMHNNAEEGVPIVVQVPRALRTSIGQLKSLRVQSPSGTLVPLGTLVSIEEVIAPKSIFHKNLMPVVYVTGDVAGAEESPIYAILKLNRALDSLQLPEGYSMQRFVAQQPFSTAKYAMK